jgi:hypothetical protein
MSAPTTLVFDIRSCWHPGTGRGGGTRLDAVTHRDRSRLPALPGRTVKGLVRDAVYRWECFGGYYPANERPEVSCTEQLFGPHGEGAETWPGLLRFSSATLPEEVAEYLAATPELAAGLYRSHFSTAIERESGTALKNSLRGIEVVVPLTLYAKVVTLPGARHRDLEQDWPRLLRAALPLLRAVGAHRSRGLGRARVTLPEEASR